MTGATKTTIRVIRAIGVESNRDGLGAPVRALAGDLLQTREIRRSYGYMGSSDVRLILGLGDRTQVDSLEIRWPSGAVQALVKVAADQTVVIREAADD